MSLRNHNKPLYDPQPMISIPSERREVVPKALEAVMYRHLTRCAIDGCCPGSARILGIEGAPGIGKTYSAHLVLRNLRVQTYSMGGAEFGSQFEGGPSDLLRQLYRDAQKHSLERREPTCLLINDMDTAFGNIPGKVVNTSNNPYLFIGALMDFCDEIHEPGGNTFPVPIILTGNHFAGLCEPLTRFGRMEIFHWAPTREDLAAVLPGMFLTLGASELETLLRTFPEEKVAFFTELRYVAQSEVMRIMSPEDLWKRTAQQADYLKGVARRDPPRTLEIPLDFLLEVGRSLQASRRNSSLGTA